MRANDCTLLVVLSSFTFFSHTTNSPLCQLAKMLISAWFVYYTLFFVVCVVFLLNLRFTLFLVSLIKNKNAFASCTLSLSLCIAFYFCFHDPTFKLLVLLLRYPPLCARLPLTADAYCSPPPPPSHCLWIFFFFCLCVQLIPEPSSFITTSHLSLSSLQHTWYTVECVASRLVSGHQQSSRRRNCWWWWWW